MSPIPEHFLRGEGRSELVFAPGSVVGGVGGVVHYGDGKELELEGWEEGGGGAFVAHYCCEVAAGGTAPDGGFF